jgi:alkyl hydroperoxide reductase subunit AhpC
MMFGAIAHQAAFVGRRAAARSFATIGSQVPSVELHKNFPPEKINIQEYTKDRNVVIVGLPGAFTPT